MSNEVPNIGGITPKDQLQKVQHVGLPAATGQDKNVAEKTKIEDSSTVSSETVVKTPSLPEMLAEAMKVQQEKVAAEEAKLKTLMEGSGKIQPEAVATGGFMISGVGSAAKVDLYRELNLLGPTSLPESGEGFYLGMPS